MWRNKTVSVILPTYNEKDSIRKCIQDFFATGVVDQVIVINNNAAPGTSEEVQGTGAIEIHEAEQGYGAAIQRGFRESTSDFVAVCEPDGTFEARDIEKLLAYTQDFDVVLGTRTAKEMIWEGANMGIFLKWGNYAVAKMMEFLFNSNNLTDVGCTYRVASRKALEVLMPQFRVKSSFFGPEMMLLTLKNKLTMVQIPLNYKKRVGTSSVTGDPIKAFILGCQMIVLILKHKFLLGHAFKYSKTYPTRKDA
jgi:glycosyltransferase involved in cell wall biosynthesis